MIRLKAYKTIVLDCDGVILNSNNIKTEAFFHVTKKFGENYASRLVEYHINNGGISRYKKFDYFIKEILPPGNVGKLSSEHLIREFSHKIEESLINCEIESSLFQFRKMTSKSSWMLVSGGQEDELSRVFIRRGISHLFDKGIFGSPENKISILKREIKNNTIQFPAVYIGDSTYDFLAASTVGIDFIFLSQWSEVKNHVKFCLKNNIRSFKSITDLIEKANCV